MWHLQEEEDQVDTEEHGKQAVDGTLIGRRFSDDKQDKKLAGNINSCKKPRPTINIQLHKCTVILIFWGAF